MCHLCGKRFHSSLSSRAWPARYALIAHMKTVHDPLACKHCGGTFVGKTGLAQHMAKDHSDLVRKFLCPHCPMVFNKANRLRYHKIEVHKTEEYPFR